MAPAEPRPWIGYLVAFLLSTAVMVLAAASAGGVIAYREATGRSIPVRQVAPSTAPEPVRTAAVSLESVRGALLIPAGRTTYLVISAGGWPVRLDSVRLQTGQSVDVQIRRASDGASFLILAFQTGTLTGKAVHCFLYRYPEIPVKEWGAVP